jgi:hypothetical protein
MFALRSLRLVDHLPRTMSGRAIGQSARSIRDIGGRQLSRGVPFAVARGIRRENWSSAEEADESVYWLELISEGKLLPEAKVIDLLEEANELTAIFTSARRTSTQNQTSKFKPQTSLS